MKLLVNNTEQIQPQEYDGTKIVLYCRNAQEPAQRRKVVADGFEPYFYAARDEVAGNPQHFLQHDSVAAIDTDPEYGALEGTELARIQTPYPQDVPEAKQLFDDHYAADVAFTNRFRIDREIEAYIEVPDGAFDGSVAEVDYREITPVEPGSGSDTPTLEAVEPRVLTFDIEVDDRGAGFPELGDERILSIVAHDNFTDETRAFVDLDGRDVNDALPDGLPDTIDALDYRPSERQMLIAFRSWFQDIDPDIITGWNCLPGDSRVQMSDGSECKISDVSVGDEIVGVDGQSPTTGTVTNKWESEKEILSFKLADGKEFRSSEEHRVMVGDRNDVDWKRAEKIEPGDMVLRPRKLPVSERAETWLTQHDMYLAGLIMSDGTMERGQGITFYNTKEELHNEFYKDNAQTPDKTGCFSQNVLDTEYAKEFERLGIPFGDKNSDGAKLDTLYRLSEQKIAPFIAGVIDGDGSISGGAVTVSAKNNTTREWYRKLFHRIGVFATDQNKVVYVSQSEQNKERLQEKVSPWLSHPEKDFSNVGGVSGPTDTIPGALIETERGSDERRITNDKLRRGINCKRHETLNDEWLEWVFVPVEEVSKNGIETTYDIETTVSSFIADDVLVHNCDDFDIPFLIERMEKLQGLNPNTLSPEDWAGITRGGEPRIKGRTVYDLLTVYKKNSFTEISSYTLDSVAREELGAEKIDFDGDFYELYENDTAEFLRYNARDVDLAVGINREADVIQFRDVLRREVGVDFEDSYDNKDFVDMMCRRRLHEWKKVGPTRPAFGEEPESDYEGGHVFDAYTGVAKNVVGIDLASLYPYTMAMLNASPETKSDIEGTSGTPPACIASNGQAFQLDKQGLFTSLVDDAINLKSDYKEKLLAADDKKEREKWQSKYAAAKTITNSIYGVTGWERFFLYDEKVAEAVTLTGQTVIKRTAEFVEAEGYDVIYGDTDSTYIKFPDGWSKERCLAEAESLCDKLNNSVYPELAKSIGVPAEENLWDIEVEAYMQRFFQAGRKKRYAYLATWKDGHDIEDPEPSISGFSSKRSDSAELTTETERQVLDAILHGNTDAVHDIVFEAAQEIQRNSPNWERIGIPGGMNNKIDKSRAGQDGYYAFSEEGYPQDAHPRAVWNSNKVLDVRITSSDKPMRVYIEETAFEELGRSADVLAFIENSDMEAVADSVYVDVPRMTETILKKPLGNILQAIGMDVDAVVRGQTQTGLGAFS